MKTNDELIAEAQAEYEENVKLTARSLLEQTMRRMDEGTHLPENIHASMAITIGSEEACVSFMQGNFREMVAVMKALAESMEEAGLEEDDGKISMEEGNTIFVSKDLGGYE